MLHVGETLGQRLKEPGAVPRALRACAYAHLLEQEVVVRSRALKMTERESEYLAVRVQRADTIGARSRKEVAEPLRSIVGSPPFVPGRCIEGVDVEGDAGG